MKRALLSLLCSLLLAAGATAAELADLGHGLGYLRVSSPEEAVQPLAGSGAIVLDLRRTSATPETAASFTAAVAARPAGSRLFVLVGPATPPLLSTALKGHLVTLGIKDSQPEPQVVVQQSTEDDARACDALAAGTPLAGLISGKVSKERYDEASLVQEFKNGNHEARPPDSPPAAKKTAPPLTDRVLQRAVHLHQALLALKKM